MALFLVHNEREFHIGDVIRVHQKIQEDQKARTQIFEGTVIAIKGESPNKTFTVRRIGAGRIGIERIFPLLSPLIEKVEVKARGRVRRAKLYYLREKTATELAEITKRYHRAGKQSKPKSKLARRSFSEGGSKTKTKKKAKS